MAIVVQKFGGSSVADPDKIRGVAEHVAAARAHGDDVVVVVSAMGKTTDNLLSLARQIHDTPPRRELDMLLSTGERISMALLSMALHRMGVDAISFTGSQSGILTNDRHFEADIIDVRPHRVLDELARGRVVIVAGYQGMSYKREITTLGRGGSDTSAVAMAAALGAARCEIYSDVDGVYSADPRVVPEARHFAEIGYDVMHAMSVLGAKVLHHRAVETARRAALRIHARSTFAPGRETRVHASAAPETRAVVGQRGVVRLRLPRDGTRIAHLRQTLRPYGIFLDAVEESGDAPTSLAVRQNIPDWARAAEALASEGVTLDESLGTISLIGSPDDVRRGAPMLEDLGVTSVQTMDEGRATRGIVPEAALDDVTRAVHARFVEAPV